MATPMSERITDRRIDVQELSPRIFAQEKHRTNA